jgi:hypothetical protein
MAALLSENAGDDNGGNTATLPEIKGMHAGRNLAYVGGIAVLSMAETQIFQSPPVMSAIKPIHHLEWIEIERPFAAFARSIPEADDVPWAMPSATRCWRRRRSIARGRARTRRPKQNAAIRVTR